VPGVTRRSFLATLGGAAAAAGVASRVPAAGGTNPAGPTDPAYRYFRPAEARFVEAACNRLIPADHAGAGALDAGVPQYLDAQLAGEWGSGRRAFRSGVWQPGTPARLDPAVARAPSGSPAESFRAGLTGVLDHLASRQVDFAAAPPAAQAAFLRRLESGAVALDGTCSTEFFDMLLAMTVEGFFSHPGLGATRDRVDWRMRGFPGACVRPA
jgi:gluconate 2-dehydrogenase gamma chain